MNNTQLTSEGKCCFCGRLPSDPFSRRDVSGKLVNHCAGKSHRPHIMPGTEAAAMMRRYDAATAKTRRMR